MLLFFCPAENVLWTPTVVSSQFATSVRTTEMSSMQKNDSRVCIFSQIFTTWFA